MDNNFSRKNIMAKNVEHFGDEDRLTGLPIFLLTNWHPQKFFEKATYQFEPKAVDNIDKLRKVFFSAENIKYLQERIINEVYLTTEKKYKIPYQNEQDLRGVMIYLYYLETRNVGYALNEQLKDLNDIVIKFTVPKIINELYVYLNYLNDVQTPRKINTLPSSNGRLRSVAGLPSPNYLYENVYLPNMASKFYYSTSGDLNDVLPPEVNLNAINSSIHIDGSPSMTPSAYPESPIQYQIGGKLQGVSYGGNTPGYTDLSSVAVGDASAPPTSSHNWYPSASIFQDDPYYIRNSLLSPNTLKPRVPAKTFPNEKNGLYSSAEGSDYFIPDNRIDDRYASV